MPLQLTLAFLITCLALSSQAQMIYVTSSQLGTRTYSVDNDRLPRRKVVRLLKEDPRSKKYIRRSQVIRVTSMCVAFTGGFITGYSLASVNALLGATGVGIITIGLVLGLASDSIEQTAIDVYNESRSTKPHEPDNF